MKQKLAIRTIVLLGDPEWVDHTLNRSWLQEGVLHDQMGSRALAGGQAIELRRKVEYVDTPTREDALRQIEEAGSPLLRDPLTTLHVDAVLREKDIPNLGRPPVLEGQLEEPPNTTDLPEEGKES